MSVDSETFGKAKTLQHFTSHETFDFRTSSQYKISDGRSLTEEEYYAHLVDKHLPEHERTECEDQRDASSGRERPPAQSDSRKEDPDANPSRSRRPFYRGTSRVQPKKDSDTHSNGSGHLEIRSRPTKFLLELLTMMLIVLSDESSGIGHGENVEKPKRDRTEATKSTVYDRRLSDRACETELQAK